MLTTIRPKPKPARTPKKKSLFCQCKYPNVDRNYYKSCAKSVGAADGSPAWPQIQARRRRWAELLQRIFEVDPFRCPCGGDMRIVAFVLDHQVVHAILRHLRKSRPDPRALREHDDLHVGRAPP